MDESARYTYYDSFITMKRWMENRNAGKMLDAYFREHGYKTIAIYGAGDLGKLLYEELKNTDIKVLYFIDRNAEGLYQIEDIPVIDLDAVTENKGIDALVVTPLGDYNVICSDLIGIAPEVSILSLKDAVYEL
jgi:lactate dehydrogenase-like 2-hydroxyacid dehydrogenase